LWQGEGAAVGTLVGLKVATVGAAEGRTEGVTLDRDDGEPLGDVDGYLDGKKLGNVDGCLEGTSVGDEDGNAEGSSLGRFDGKILGDTDGNADVVKLGDIDGDTDGVCEGTTLGWTDGVFEGATLRRTDGKGLTVGRDDFDYGVGYWWECCDLIPIQFHLKLFWLSTSTTCITSFFNATITTLPRFIVKKNTLSNLLQRGIRYRLMRKYQNNTCRYLQD